LEVVEMLKKLALPVVALAMILILTSAPAKAAVRFGVTIGPPVYTYPAYPYYSAPYVDPYYAPNYYYAPAPAYVYPSPSFGFGWSSGHRDHDRGRFENRGNQFRGHDNHGRGDNHGGHRR
jgi:hypothetical protein